MPIPDTVKRSPHLLFFTIGGQVLRCFLLVQVLEEFFHAVVPVVKSRPEWLRGMLVANLYARDKKTIWLFMFVAIQHQGNWSPLDSFHISAAGPLSVLVVAGLGFVVILAYGLLSDASILYSSLALSPFLVNGLLSLVPVRAVVGSDGANMVAMAHQLGLGPLQFFKESLRSVELIANYLARHALAGVRIQRVLLLGIVIACGLLLTAS